MARTAQDVTEAELELMRLLWERGRLSVRQLADLVFPAAANAAQYATVQKQLERLEAKQYVRRDRSLFVHIFSASVDRDELIGRRLRAMADKLCGGSLTPILSNLAQNDALTGPQRRALRELIEQGEEPRRNRGPARKR